MEKYLPSKKFRIFLLVLLGTAAIVLAGSQIFSVKTKTTNSAQLKIAGGNELTLSDLLEKDSDQDGLRDWEEVLWGTDPNKKITFENTPDKDWVENKQKSLAPRSELADENVNQTEQLSQELYSVLAALKAGGQADQNTVYSISSALGGRLANSELPDFFKAEDLSDAETSVADYLDNMALFIQSYDETSLGQELLVLTAVLNQKEDPEKILEIAGFYKSIAETGKTIAAPLVFKENHLSIINNAWKVGASLESLAKTLDDPLIGMIGLIQYQKYSEVFMEAVEGLNKIARS